MVAMGMAEAITLGLGAVGIACPPCAHRTVAPICKIGPGIVISRLLTYHIVI